jgi:uncharacterized protein YndB with AHSA1/START domain
MIDVIQQIEAVQREVGSGRLPAGEARVIRMRRTYDSSIDDVWDALSDPSRISRWFLPVSGDFRIGGRFQFEGNAGGEILACERPERLKVSWVMGDPSDPAAVSELEVRLHRAREDATTLELEHVAVVPDEMWDQFGPGAVGVGWDGGFLGLGLHLASGATVEDPMAWQLSDEGREFSERSSQAWGAANLAAGADPEVVARNVEATTSFYTTAPEEPGTGDGG